MSQRGALGHSSGNHYLSHDCGVDLRQYHRDHEHAAQASAELLIATNKAIFKWGFKHGITSDQARILLMDRRMP